MKRIEQAINVALLIGALGYGGWAYFADRSDEHIQVSASQRAVDYACAYTRGYLDAMAYARSIAPEPLTETPEHLCTKFAVEAAAGGFKANQ